MYNKEWLADKVKTVTDKLSENKYLKDKKVLQALALVFSFGLVTGVCATGAESAVNTINNNPTAGISSVLASNSSAYRASATAGISSVLAVNVDAESQLYASATEVVSTAAGASEDYGYDNLGMGKCEGNLNVREEPDESGKILGKLPEHGAVEIIDEVDGWFQIESGELEGYVKAEYIATGDEALEIAADEIATMATVTGDGLRIRQAPSTDSEVIINLSSGEKLPVLEELDGWVKVAVDTDEGYVSADYVEIADELPTAKTLEELAYGTGVSDVRVALVNNALQYVGNRYVWGGTSLTNGVDCSGFTMRIYQQYGIYLPHSSRAQAGYGRTISASQAQPGDLFFYGSGGISHVAIYMGGGQIVHASSARTGIKISNAFYRTPIKVVTLLN
ncbi:MAG: C40 family peptidase [Lachnospiraceae bacterium]|nr:C40 family peptidase [Lachnospiraceae bacterium]